MLKALLIMYILALGFGGYRLMGRLDRFLRENKKAIRAEKKEDESRLVRAAEAREDPDGE